MTNLCATCMIKNNMLYIEDIRTLEKALNHRLVLQKVHRVVKFNQKPWLKRYIDMNASLQKRL